MQNGLFSGPEISVPIAGLHYEPEFLTIEEEVHLLDVIRSLPLHAAKYKEYVARRMVVSFGGSYDFSKNKLLSGQPLDERLFFLRDRIAAWMNVAPEQLAQVLVAQYNPGTPLGWHRDVPDFETIAGISLGNAALLRFRPYPPTVENKRRVLQLEVAPRSIYKIEGKARWEWQHSVPPVTASRWSITFRTRRMKVFKSG